MMKEQLELLGMENGEQEHVQEKLVQDAANALARAEAGKTGNLDRSKSRRLNGLFGRGNRQTLKGDELLEENVLDSLDNVMQKDVEKMDDNNDAEEDDF